MAAYCIVRVDVHDSEAYGRYAAIAGEAVVKYGGTFLARGGQTIVKEGEARARNVVIEFPSVEAAETFYHSPEYQEAMSHGLPASTRDYIIVEGA
jgi:uncharacterized protein (DUF1330 family)